MRRAMKQTMRVTIRAAAAAMLLTGCMAGPEPVTQSASLEEGSAAEVPSAVWRQVEACFGPEVHEALGLAAVEGEPTLAALIDVNGAVRCVDARETLEEDGLADLLAIDLDPSFEPASDREGTLSVVNGMPNALHAERPALFDDEVDEESTSSQPEEPIGPVRIPHLPNLWLGTQAASGDPVPEPM